MPSVVNEMFTNSKNAIQIQLISFEKYQQQKSRWVSTTLWSKFEALVFWKAASVVLYEDSEDLDLILYSPWVKNSIRAVFRLYTNPNETITIHVFRPKVQILFSNPKSSFQAHNHFSFSKIEFSSETNVWNVYAWA